MRAILTVAGLSLLAAPALAEDVQIELTIPRLDVAEYHRPYVAVWIAAPDQTVVANLAVWYQQARSNGGEKGETWLKELRQWWRRSGRELDMPVDGVSGPTKAPGVQEISLPTDAGPLSKLKPGDYILVAEAVREVGGREMVSVPFSWPLKAAVTGAGSEELGKVSLRISN
ncbi:MAG: DUF2271 domain-containing protein [Acidobacteria bacterium]|nr:DUF2271 domain-containing protein [Acidobacteriota bacterium]